MDMDQADELSARVNEARMTCTPLNIEGGGSKGFYGRVSAGQSLSVRKHRGIMHYEPTELVMTARSGTPLQEIEATLAEHNQMLAFEPPCYGSNATLGGAIATGLSGPRRPYSGAARDFVLGVHCLTGKGECLRFGGEVMKNVAGFDVSRLMVGALGTLGILLDVSLKVMPKQEREQSLVFVLPVADAIMQMNRWASQPIPVTAACYDGERLIVRLSGTDTGVAAAQKQLGGDLMADGAGFWHSVREQQHPFFQHDAPLWRLSLPAAAPPLNILGQWFIDWGGAHRWLKTALPNPIVREAALRAGGHAMVFRGGDRHGSVFHPLSDGLLTLHKRLKAAFDPEGILNPGRLHPEL